MGFPSHATVWKTRAVVLILSAAYGGWQASGWWSTGETYRLVGAICWLLIAVAIAQALWMTRKDA